MIRLVLFASLALADNTDVAQADKQDATDAAELLKQIAEEYARAKAAQKAAELAKPAEKSSEQEAVVEVEKK